MPLAAACTHALEHVWRLSGVREGSLCDPGQHAAGDGLSESVATDLEEGAEHGLVRRVESLVGVDVLGGVILLRPATVFTHYELRHDAFGSALLITELK